MDRQHSGNSCLGMRRLHSDMTALVQLLRECCAPTNYPTSPLLRRTSGALALSLGGAALHNQHEKKGLSASVGEFVCSHLLARSSAHPARGGTGPAVLSALGTQERSVSTGVILPTLLFLRFVLTERWG